MTKLTKNETPAKTAKPKKQPAIAKSAPAPKAIKSVTVAKPDRVFTAKAGTKRGIAYEALTRPEGCSLAQGVELLGWGRSVVSSEFWEIAKLAKKKLVRDGETYRLA